MTQLLYANNAIGTLASPVTNIATTCTLNAGQAALFPNPAAGQAFYATFTDAATQTLKEIVLVTAVAGNVFSITRAQDGTSALSWNANDFITQNTVAVELRNFVAVNTPALGLIMPNTVTGIGGTTLADDAQAGSVGEYVTATTTGASPPNTGAAYNQAQITLSAGDWDVSGAIQYALTGVTGFGGASSSISTTSATFPGTGANSATGNVALNSGTTNISIATPTVRVNVSLSTIVYLIGGFGYTGGTVAGSGLLRARRVR